LCLLLSPVISIDPFNVITYDKDCIVKLVLHDEGDEERPQRWVKVLKGGYFIRGSSFDASPHIVGRTIVVDGIYHEEASKKVRKSARGVVPMRFVPLFEEAVDPTPIIW
jgi:hypothetical protein